MEAKLLQIAANSDARNIIAEIKEVFAQEEKQPVQLVPVLRIVLERIGVFPNPAAKRFCKIYLSAPASYCSLMPDITRLFIQNDMPLDGMKQLLNDFTASRYYLDGIEYDYHSLTVHMLENPALVTSKTSPEEIDTKIRELRQMVGNLEWSTFVDLVFQKNEGQAYADIMTSLRFFRTDVEIGCTDSEEIGLNNLFY